MECQPTVMPMTNDSTMIYSRIVEDYKRYVEIIKQSCSLIDAFKDVVAYPDELARQYDATVKETKSLRDRAYDALVMNLSTHKYMFAKTVLPVEYRTTTVHNIECYIIHIDYRDTKDGVCHLCAVVPVDYEFISVNNKYVLVPDKVFQEMKIVETNQNNELNQQ